MFDNVKIGNRAEISLERDGSKINSYTTRVEIIDSENEVFLSFPVSAGQYVKLPKINEYQIVFYTDLGLYRFRAGVEKYVKIDGLPYIKVNILDEGRKVQRREFFRYEYVKEFEFSVINDSGNEISDNKIDELLKGIDEDVLEDTFIAISKDIGAGGIRFVTNEDIDRTDKIKIYYEIKDSIIIVEAIILDKMEINEPNYKYQIRCKFTNITESDKENIISFIFNEQRKRLRVTR